MAKTAETIEIPSRDRGISTIRSSFFNTDKEDRKFITRDEAKSVFDYSVAKEPDFRPNGVEIPGHFHLIRKDSEDDEGIVIGKTGVGSEFSVGTQPMDVLNFFYDNILPEVPEMQLETIATYENGASSFANFHIGDEYQVPGDSSSNFMNVLYINPLTAGTIKLLSHTIRVVCMNTLAMAQNTGEGFKIPHTINSALYVQCALDSVKNQIIEAQNLKDISFELAAKELNSKTVNKILEKIYPTKKKDDEVSTRMKNNQLAALKQFESDSSFNKKNAWSFLNALTYGVEHPNLTEKRTGPKVQFDNIFGGRSIQKSRMLTTVMGEVGLIAA